MEVVERNTGTFKSVRFSSIESFILSANIAKQTSRTGPNGVCPGDVVGCCQMFTVSFTGPYFFDSRWLLSFDVFNNSEVFYTFRACAPAETSRGAPIYR